uniref:Uncharacterized protein n=1 Tax=Rhizophora mucronata TaxID=61149 RepID=A0A2P2QJX7_RHIMU
MYDLLLLIFIWVSCNLFL